MRQPDDCGLGHIRVPVQHCLDAQAGHVLPAGLDDVLIAVDHDPKAVVVNHATVAGVEPAVPEGLLGRRLVLVVPGGDRGRPVDRLARDTRLVQQVPALGVHHGGGEQRIRDTHVVHLRGGGQVLVLPHVRPEPVAGDGLGLAEDADQQEVLGAALLEAGQHGWLDRAPPVHENPQRTAIYPGIRSHPGIRSPPRTGGHRSGERLDQLRGATPQGRDLLPGDRGGHFLRHWLAADHQRAAGQEGRQGQHLIRDVVDDRQERAQPQVGLDAEAAGERQREGIGAHVRVGVGQHHPLGQRCGARGEEDLPDVIPMHHRVRFRRRLAGDELSERHTAADHVPADRDAHISPQARRGECVPSLWPQLGVNHDQAGLGQCDQVPEHVRGEGGVDRDGHQASLGRGQLGQVRLDGVLTDQQDPVAALQAPRQQAVGEAVDDVVGLPVGQALTLWFGERPSPADDRDLIRAAPGHPLQDVPDTDPVPAVVRTSVVEARDIDRHGGLSLARGSAGSSRL